MSVHCTSFNKQKTLFKKRLELQKESKNCNYIKYLK